MPHKLSGATAGELAQPSLLDHAMPHIHQNSN